VAHHYDSASGLTLTASRADLLKTVAQSQPRSYGAGDTFLTVPYRPILARLDCHAWLSVRRPERRISRGSRRLAAVAERDRNTGSPSSLSLNSVSGHCVRYVCGCAQNIRFRSRVARRGGQSRSMWEGLGILSHRCVKSVPLEAGAARLAVCRHRTGRLPPGLGRLRRLLAARLGIRVGGASGLRRMRPRGRWWPRAHKPRRALGVWVLCEDRSLRSGALQCGRPDLDGPLTGYRCPVGKFPGYCCHHDPPPPPPPPPPEKPPPEKPPPEKPLLDEPPLDALAIQLLVFVAKWCMAEK
jgi:hypothetical protein